MSFDMSEIHLKHIGLNDVELRMLTQACGQIAVQLNHGQAAKPLHQGLGQCSKTRANFNHKLPRTRVDSQDYGVNNAVVCQKMLPKALARDVFHITPPFFYWGGSRNST